ncbi:MULTISPECIES: hypothetical protein [Sphingomonadales]|uniref:Uncharacterized protein n=2 Tax=Edaphosphingomonas TaxID=3423724 RepID=A0A2T4HRY0_9SPHN|nr:MULTISPECIES: hypothetical protein [Sphingomonas]AGH50300.1 hypothetical protein G432_12905 [Sphingomonas sp. MM-1]MDX3885350.1 hypothetical protein [Sphingomonas sp.]PTD18517.1 hypothetical protein CV103_14720 [Sphingomonas fennica]
MGAAAGISINQDARSNAPRNEMQTINHKNARNETRRPPMPAYDPAIRAAGSALLSQRELRRIVADIIG